MHDLGPRREDPSAGDFSVAADEVTCQQFVEVITDYLEGELPARTLGLVEEHLVMCDWCVTYMEQMETTVDLLGDLRESATPSVSETLLIALRGQRDGEA